MNMRYANKIDKVVLKKKMIEIVDEHNVHFSDNANFT